MALQPVILALDTSTPSCSVALTKGCTEDGQILGSLCLGGMTHSRRLLQSVDILMDGLGICWQDLSGIAVSLGPGSFTGLRIGMATAKGLAMAANLPLVGCSTLRCLAASLLVGNGQRVCSVLDARKKEVYAACYHRNGSELVEEGGKRVLAPSVLARELTDNFLLVGDGAALYRALFVDVLGERVRFAPTWCHQPSAQILGFLAASKFLAGDFLDIGSVSPCYVRRSDAELNLAKKKREADDSSS